MDSVKAGRLRRQATQREAARRGRRRLFWVTAAMVLTAVGVGWGYYLFLSPQARARRLLAELRNTPLGVIDRSMAWLGLLKSRPRREPAKVVADLVAMGPVASEGLVKALGDTDWEVRHCAALGLGQIRPVSDEAVEGLIGAMQDTEYLVRASAIEGLGLIGPRASRAVPDLVRALSDPNEVVGQDAAEALAEMGDDGQRAVGDIVKLLDSHSHRTFLSAASALVELGPRAEAAVPALIRMLDHPIPARAEGAAATLSCLGATAAPAVGALAKTLRHKSPRVAHQAAWALVRLGPLAAAAVPELLRATEREDLPKEPVLQALRDLKAQPERILPALRTALRGYDSSSARVAARILGELGAPAAEAIGDLARALRHHDPRVAAMAAHALRMHGDRAKQAADALEGVLAHRDPEVRVEAALALLRMGKTDVAVATLVEMLGDERTYFGQVARERLTRHAGQEQWLRFLLDTPTGKQLVAGRGVLLGTKDLIRALSKYKKSQSPSDGSD